jgi:outer membrane protein assembly factor BamD (BamD/ComL family)
VRRLEPSPTRASSLADETELLQAARAALARGDHRGALALADAHRRRFPGGALAEEAEVTRILGLCGVGDTAAARTASAAFLERFPRSPLRTRILSSCAGPGAIP